HHIALIDVGMVGRLSAGAQEQLFKLLLALSEGRGDDAASVIIALGERRDDFDEAQVRRAILDMVNPHERAATKDVNVGRVVLEMARCGSQHGLKMAPELALLGKT